METLTPVQRVAVVTIGLALTAACIIVVLPWAGRQVVARLPPTRTPAPMATPSPTATPGQQAVPTVAPTVALTPPPARVSLGNVAHIYQIADNSAPAALEMVLDYWGYTDNQEAIASKVRPGELDRSVELVELAAYARAHELATHVAVNGKLEVLRGLLANGFPIVAAGWLTTTEGTGTRQVQVVRGYDHDAETFTVHDPSAGPDVTISYSDVDEGWRATNRSYLLVYPAENEDRVRAILADEWTTTEMWENALARAEQELETDAQDATAQLNRASALAALKRCDQAREAFDGAQEIGLPTGLLRYRYGIHECLLNLAAYQDVLDLTQAEIDDGAALEELHLYRAQAYVALGDAALARVEYSRALDIHPGWPPAEEGLSGLPE